MLIDCPRCGFNQPKDTYCAQCGIDMLAYKAPEVSAGQRLLQNIFFQTVAILTIAGAGIGYFLSQRPAHPPEDVFQRYSRPSQLISQPKSDATEVQIEMKQRSAAPANSAAAPIAKSAPSPDPETFPAVDDPATTEISLASESSEVAITDNTNPEEPASSAAASNLAAQAAPAPTAGELPYRIRLFLVEIKADYLRLMIDEATRKNLFSRYPDSGFSAGISSSSSRVISPSNPAAKIILSESKNLDLTTPISFPFTGPQVGPLAVGIEISVSLHGYDGTTFGGELRIQRQWRMSGDTSLPPERVSSPASFEITRENGFFVAGVIPRQSPTIMDQLLGKSPLLEVMRSEDFKSGRSDFVFLIEFDNASN